MSWISLDESHLAGDGEVSCAGTVGSTIEDQVPGDNESPVEDTQESIPESIPESISISQVSCILPVTRLSQVNSRSWPLDTGACVHDDIVIGTQNMVGMFLIRASRCSAHEGLTPR